MATVKGPWSPQGVILFSQGELSYEFIRHEAFTDHGEHVMLARQRSRRGAEGQVMVRCLPPTSVREDFDTHARARARLEEEVRLASYLDHPNIARILAHCEVQGVLYVVSEFVPGPSLHTLIDASMARKVRLSEAFTLYVGAEVASALHHAHTRTDERGQPLGILHRDVSPGRIHLRPNGALTLTDFALARSRLPGRVRTTVPHAQGDTFYASPEALLLEELDARSDLFALGLVLLELATWKALYAPRTAHPSELERTLAPPLQAQVQAAGAVAVAKHLPGHTDDCILRAATYCLEDVEALTQPLSPPLRSILCTLLQRRPEDRYPSAAVLERALREGLAAQEAPYGAAEAVAEARRAVSWARQPPPPSGSA